MSELARYSTRDLLREVLSRQASPGDAKHRVTARRLLGKCTVCHGLRHIETGLITYIAQRGGYFKVGASRHPVQRLHALTVSPYTVLSPPDLDLTEPFKLLALTDEDEHDVHERLAARHAHGEWFRA